jgi:choline-sulfatase
MDLQATVFRATASRRPAGWRGSPLQSIRPDDERRVAFCEYHGHGARCSSFMVRKGRWKLIEHTEAPHQLFDLASDPDELRNLADERPRELRDLKAELRRICDPEAENRKAERTIAAQIEAIRAMGLAPGATP